MTVLRGGYVGAKSCKAGPQVGVVAFMSWFLAAYTALGGRNLGIYNCRPVRGGVITSLHGEGRAADLGCPVGNSWMQGLCDLLIRFSAELGIQCIIYNRRIWSSTYPDGWRRYTGVNPHTDHAHVEFTWASAVSLTVAAIRAALTAPAPGGQWEQRVNAAPGSRTVKRWSVGDDVAVVQRWHGLDADGYFGPATEAKVKETQARNGVDVDGIVGPVTWRLMGIGTPRPPAPPPPPKDTLPAGGTLGPGGTLVGGGFKAVMQHDGNFVVYDSRGRARWSSRTDRQPGARLVMQDDGNLVIYRGTRALWDTKTRGRGNRLVMQADGNLVVYTTGNRPVWALW